MKDYKAAKAAILAKYEGVKLHQTKNPVILSAYRSLIKPFPYRSCTNIMLVINIRAYYVRTAKLMASVIKHAQENPEILLRKKSNYATERKKRS